MTTPEEMAINPFLSARWQSFALGALWLGFVIYGVLLSPPSQPDTLDVILQLSTGRWAQLNPMVVILFNLMGLWPVVYASLALADGRDQRVSAWPFVVGAFGFGAFALMPYLVLRKPACDLPYPTAETLLLKGVGHRLVGVGVAIAILVLIGYGVARGGWYETWQDFLHQFATNQFIHVMSLDFCMLTLLTPSLLWDDIARRNLSPGWRAVSLIPLLGPAVYLALRPAAAAPQ